MASYANLCRLCLGTETNKKDLFTDGNSTKYYKQLTEVFQIEV